MKSYNIRSEKTLQRVLKSAKEVVSDFHKLSTCLSFRINKDSPKMMKEHDYSSVRRLEREFEVMNLFSSLIRNSKRIHDSWMHAYRGRP